MSKTPAEIAAIVGDLQDKVGKNWDADVMTTPCILSTGIQSVLELAGIEWQLWDSDTYPPDYGSRNDRVIVNTNNQTAEITGISVG